MTEKELDAIELKDIVNFDLLDDVMRALLPTKEDFIKDMKKRGGRQRDTSQIY